MYINVYSTQYNIYGDVFAEMQIWAQECQDLHTYIALDG